jgi:hypothetical protein
MSHFSVSLLLRFAAQYQPLTPRLCKQILQGSSDQSSVAERKISICIIIPVTSAYRLGERKEVLYKGSTSATAKNKVVLVISQDCLSSMLHDWFGSLLHIIILEA